jgi:predicted secreted Zn-dependent protease
MHGQQNIKIVKQVEEAVKNSAVISNDLECEKYRISVGSFVIMYRHNV